MGHSKSSPKREIHSHTGLPQETKIVSNNLTLQLKELGKEQQTKPNVRGKGIIKIRDEINKRESKKITQKINETKSWFFENIDKIDKLLNTLIKKKREREDPD